jgi:hypothetical protein
LQGVVLHEPGVEDKQDRTEPDYPMSSAIVILPTPIASWSRRLAVFSLQLVLAGLLLHRFFSLSTPITLHLFATAMVGAAIAIVLALAALVIIWRLGRSGTWSAVAGIVVGAVLIAWPAAYVPYYTSLPRLADVTTDQMAPPRFIALAKQRPADANPVEYAGAALARLQNEAYPDLRPIIIPRPAQETYELVGDIVRRQRWQIAGEQAPQGRGRPGYVEATERTLIMGFYDDVVIRIDGDAQESRIDVRSASRYGQHDLGRNAARVRKLFAEIRTQLETGAPVGSKRRRGKPGAVVARRGKGGPEAAGLQSKRQGAGQSGSQRGQPPKGKQPARGEGQARDKR